MGQWVYKTLKRELRCYPVTSPIIPPASSLSAHCSLPYSQRRAQTLISLFVSNLMTITPPLLQWFWGFSGHGNKFTWWHLVKFLCFCCCSFAKLCPTLCDPMDCSTPGFPVLHQLSDFAQIHVHWPTISSSVVSLSSCLQSFPATGVGSLHQVAKVLELQLQHQSFQWTFRVDFLYDWLAWSPGCPGDSQESSPAPQFKGINFSALSLYGPTHIHTWLLEKP